MHQSLLFFHSALRWLVLACLLTAIWRAYRGYRGQGAFAKVDNALRHWTATVAHIQLLLGMVLYLKSPVVHYFWSQPKAAYTHGDSGFFALIHLMLMLSAIVVLTVGSALAKRRGQDHDKYKTMLLWFAAALLLIIIAIPWPFSPLASRPYWR